MSGGARRGSPASSALSLLLLAAPLLAFAPAALASRPRGATARSSPSLVADADALAKSSLEPVESASFRVFVGDELGDAHVLVFELSYPETRVRGLGLPDEARVGADRSLRLEAPWACDERSGGEATGSGEFRIFDPAGTSRSASAFGWNRLFQGREYIGFVDAYDFRARTLWPEIGRFGQEDPIGTADSTNLYQALRGAWNSYIDPTGLQTYGNLALQEPAPRPLPPAPPRPPATGPRGIVPPPSGGGAAAGAGVGVGALEVGVAGVVGAGVVGGLAGNWIVNETANLIDADADAYLAMANAAASEQASRNREKAGLKSGACAGYLPPGNVEDAIARAYQDLYNEAWLRVVNDFNMGFTRIPAGLDWATYLGQLVDKFAREALLRWLDDNGIKEGRCKDVLVNRRLRDPKGSGRYRIPDLRLKKAGKILDGTIGGKTMGSPQIQDMISYSGGYTIEIVRPTVGPMFSR